MKRSILSKRKVLAAPRLVVIPIIGPVSFNTMFNWGCSSDWHDYSRVGADYETRVKMEAAQAISDVAEQYAKAHPDVSKKVSVDLREIWLEENGQLPEKDRAQAMQARADLQELFDEHPELQEQAEYRFQDKVEQMIVTLQPTSRDDAPGKDPKDWAHVNLQND